MSRYRGPKKRLCRRFGVNLYGYKKSPLDRRGYAPGQHGQNRRFKKSEYGLHLDEKQKFRAFYGMISERQFRSTFQRARSSRQGVTGEVFVGMLESRLDTICVRMNFAPTIWAARQIVTHGHIQVNGRRLDIASYTVKPGDKVSVRPRSRRMPVIMHHFFGCKITPPPYISIESDKFTGTLEHFPERNEVPFPGEFNEQLVVEFYSR